MKLEGMDVGELGIWTSQFEFQPAAKLRKAAVDLEKLGFGAIWFPESVGREAFTHAGLILGTTKRIVVATGIANIYARDSVTAATAQKTLTEAYPGRFLLGLGVSHIPLVEQVRGHTYGKPVAAMRAYLDRMDQAPYRAVMPSVKPARLLAALNHPHTAAIYGFEESDRIHGLVLELVVRRLANQEQRAVADGIEQRTKCIGRGLEPSCGLTNDGQCFAAHDLCAPL